MPVANRADGGHVVDPSADELAFRFKGGDLALNFVATVGERWRANIERLRTPVDLDRWCHEAGLGRPLRPASDADLARARRLREAVYRTARARIQRGDIAAKDRRVINAWAMKADVPQHLDSAGRAVRARPATLDAILSTIARAAVTLLGGPDAHRIRECGSDTCSTLFVDTSRAGARLWCGKRCADRVNALRYRRRSHDLNPTNRRPNTQLT